MENIDKIYDLLNSIKVTKNNIEYIEEIKELLATQNYIEALAKMKELKEKEDKKKEEKIDEKIETEEEQKNGTYPVELSNGELEQTYIGLLLNNPKLIMKYYFEYDICKFEDEEMLNIYKSILYNEGSNTHQKKPKTNSTFQKIQINLIN